MKRSAIVLLALALSASPLRAQTPQAAFTDGLADRQSYETWFAGLQGDYKTGALYWVGQRSKKVPGSCYGPTQDWVRGCLDAKQRLDPTDRRRTTEPDYKLGWNSYGGKPGELPNASIEPSASLSVDSFRKCSRIPSSLGRLDCYDAAAGTIAPNVAAPTPARSPNGARPMLPTFDYTVSDIPDLMRQSDADPSAYVDQVIMSKKIFGASGTYAGFSRTTLPDGSYLWMTSLMSSPGETHQVGCFYKHFDERLANIPVGQPVRIFGRVGMPLKDGMMMLGADCSVVVEQ